MNAVTVTYVAIIGALYLNCLFANQADTNLVTGLLQSLVSFCVVACVFTTVYMLGLSLWCSFSVRDLSFTLLLQTSGLVSYRVS